MLEVEITDSPTSYPPDLEAHFRIRKKIFVDLLNWYLPEYDGGEYEVDKFDGSPKTRYVFFRVNGETVYSMRLLPGGHTMIEDLWPSEYEELEVASFSHVVEVSRVVRHTASKDRLKHAKALVDMLWAKLREEGFDVVVGSMDPFVHRLYCVQIDRPPLKLVPVTKDILLGKWILYS